MAIKVLMPALSPTMSEGVINKWLVNIGDTVSAGDILAEIETDKATMEVEAVDEGEITHLIDTTPDKQIAVNSVIALINGCLLYTSPSPRDRSISRMPSSA